MVVTKRLHMFNHALITKPWRFVMVLVLLLQTVCLQAGVLPEDQIEVHYAAYDGDGIDIKVPAILVRKSIGTSVSVVASQIVDKVSGASIDVRVIGASPYTEERTQTDVGVDYLYNKTTLSVAYSDSTENDFDCDYISFNVSQDLFGDLSTISLGYSRGNDTITSSVSSDFEEEAKRQNYRINWSQIATKNLILGMSYEVITDEGYMQNPYRFVRYRDASFDRGWNTEPENYPNTRTSNAWAIRGKYYLPYRAALFAEYRSFRDSWEIDASNFEIAYTHPWKDNWIFDIRYRSYSQDKAEFYSDLFERSEEKIFRARDKELSTFKNTTIGLGVTYEFKLGNIAFLDRGSVSFFIDHIEFEFDDYRDASGDGGFQFQAGEEPLYTFDVTASRFFISIFY